MRKVTERERVTFNVAMRVLLLRREPGSEGRLLRRYGVHFNTVNWGRLHAAVTSRHCWLLCQWLPALELCSIDDRVRRKVEGRRRRVKKEVATASHTEVSKKEWGFLRLSWEREILPYFLFFFFVFSPSYNFFYSLLFSIFLFTSSFLIYFTWVCFNVNF